MGILDGMDPARPGLRNVRAKTLPAVRGASALFPNPALRRLARAVLPLALAALSGCNTPPAENSYHRAARERQLDALLLLQQQQDHDRLELQTAILEDRRALGMLRDEAAVAASKRRDAELACRVELRQLTRQQAQLAQSRAQRAAVQAEIDAVRGVLADVQLQDLKLEALREQRKQLDAQVAAAERELAERTAHLRPRLQELRSRTDKAIALNAQVATALEQLQPKAPPAQPKPAESPPGPAAPAPDGKAAAPAQAPAGQAPK